ncbi:hypothetical protein DSECCO2_386610 [anaerobic digester metagenome]
MPNPADLDPLLFEKIKEEFLPEIQDAAADALSVYELGITKDGEHNFSNYTFGCVFYEGTFKRIERLCASGKSSFTCRVYSNVLEISANFIPKPVTFYIARVDKNSRQPKNAKGLKKQLHKTILQEQCYLSNEFQRRACEHGVYTIGVDIDEDNGIGNITFDLLVPVGAKSCQALHCITLYSSEEEPLAAPVPEATRKPKVHRDAAPHLAKTKLRDTKLPPEQIDKKQAIRQSVEQPAQKAKKIIRE